MIDIPIGKALVAVETPVPPEVKECDGCLLAGKCTGQFGCTSDERKDGKNVIFKLVDWPGEGQEGGDMRKHTREELDDLMERLDACHSPITVMGKVYPGNPYILNKINNFLMEGRLNLSLISFDETKIKACTKQDPPYLFHSGLDAIADDIADECEKIMNAKEAGHEGN